MAEDYFNLKLKLEELGYNHILPKDAIPLVECMVADLLQTTRSLQHYMDLSKDALKQRDSLLMEAEPYRCENAKLIQENNQLHRELITLKEDNEKLIRDSKRKIKSLSEELVKKDSIITKLQYDVRDLSLRGLCADTQSSRNKSRRKDAGDHQPPQPPKTCIYNDTVMERDNSGLSKAMYLLEEKIEIYCDEISLMKKQLEHRDKEIVRLNMTLEGGRPITSFNTDCYNRTTESKLQEVTKQLLDLEISNDQLKKEIDNRLEKQHEAMLRALHLAEENKKIQEELHKVDALALKVEEDCNIQLGTLMNELNQLQTKMESLSKKNAELEKTILDKTEFSPQSTRLQEKIRMLIKEKETSQCEINNLLETIAQLQDKIKLLSEATNRKTHDQTFPTKHELQKLLEEERKNYEKHVVEIQDKLSETISLFNKHLTRCKEKNISPKSSSESRFVKDLHQKLCVSEQKILMLKKENDELKKARSSQELGSRENYRDVISQLNAENAELSQENILLSQKLNQYKTGARFDDGDYRKKDVQDLKDDIEKLTYEIQILKKDKKEYNHRCKEALDTTDKLKRDLACKQKEIEKLQEENCSYKMTSRTGKASADHLKDECNFLREQIIRMQSDIVKEKTLASQIKNLQLETERGSNEVQNELLCIQKKLNISKDTIDTLERKCKDLQAEITTLKNDKSNLIDSIKKIDKERDELVIELDNKAETISTLEHKLKSKSHEVTRLENETSEIHRKLNINKVIEHKLLDSESQIAFLNGEILRLNQKLEAAVMENKHLQNSLGDANGTLKITKIEYDKSRKEVEGLKHQLQHYVAEIRRIEEMLSHKEAERSDMLEQFASLSVEANILENTNHSLESESASKSAQLQNYISKIESLESKLLDKENTIDSQSTRIATMTCKITALENEIKLVNEEKTILEQNVAYLKKMCNNLNSENATISAGMGDSETEMKLFENKIRNLTNAKSKLTVEYENLQDKLITMETLLSNSRREIVELKLALQDATSETKSLKQRVGRFNRREETEVHEVSSYFVCFPMNELVWLNIRNNVNRITLFPVNLIQRGTSLAFKVGRICS